MRKKLIGFVFLVLGAIAACGGSGDECSRDEDCCNGEGICYEGEDGRGICYCGE